MTRAPIGQGSGAPADAGRATAASQSNPSVSSKAGIPSAVTDHDIYYLKSCLSHLQQFYEQYNEEAQMVTLRGEVLGDNIDWLDCFIDKWERANVKG